MKSMKEKEDLAISQSASATGSTVIPESVTPNKKEKDEKEEDFQERLAGLPAKYKDEILRQYDLPETKVSLLSVLGHATWIEVVLMVVGSIMSIGAGNFQRLHPR
jgi:hypothetical protein